MGLGQFLKSLFTDQANQNLPSAEDGLRGDEPVREAWVAGNSGKAEPLKEAGGQQKWVSDAFDRARAVQNRARDMARAINSRQSPNPSTSDEAALEKARDIARSINERQNEPSPPSFER